MASTHVFPEDFEQKVGFAPIREQIASMALCAAGRELVMRSGFSCDRGRIEENLRYLNEFKTLLLLDTPFPAEGYGDERDALKRLHRPEQSLALAELHRVRQALDALIAIQEYLGQRDGYPALRSLAESVPMPTVQRDAIARIVAPDGTLRDDASPRLQQLRAQIASREERIAQRLAAILSSAQRDGMAPDGASPTLRDGRPVIPIIATHRKRFSAVVQDRSATGQTLFVEPYEVIEIQNDIDDLRQEEQEEIARLLKELSDSLRPEAETLMGAMALLVQFDTLRAKALFAARVGGAMPIVVDTPSLYIRQGVHPLLLQTLRQQGREVVSLELTLNATDRILIISGPNAGGKSLSLKTAATAVYMLQCGFLPLVGENSEMGLFDDLFIDIGDAQSIENDLSTYSSHLLAMRRVLQMASPKSLCLIDEFGAGTEPLAGGAIAEAILENLLETGTLAIITTHYSNLKGMALRHEGIINGAMLFDLSTMQPKYQLEIGAPGSSYAFEIAHRMGLPAEVTARAEAIAGEDYINLERQLRQAAKDRRYWLRKREEIRREAKESQRLKDQLEEESSTLRARQREIITQARQEAKEILRESNRAVEQTIREIKENQAESKATKAARKRLEEHAKTNEEALAKEQAAAPQPVKKQNEAPELTVGCKARIVGTDSIGEVITLNDSTAVLSLGNMLTTISVFRLEPISESSYRKATRHTAGRSVGYDAAKGINQRRLNFSSRIDLRGYRGEEALAAVQQLIDDACMMGQRQVTILHGKGSGILRERIRALLRDTPIVEEFHDEAEDLGGAGVTVVTLK